jgi:gluconokinase
VAGLSLGTRPLEIIRAAMEAMALRFVLVDRRLNEAFTETSGGKQVVASGGGLSGSPTGVRIMADALARPVVTLSTVPEASSRGAALLALEASGGPSVEEVEAPLGEVYEPYLSRHAVYKEALERQRKLYEAVISKW